MAVKQVTISQKKLDQLELAQRKLDALERWGVDNWDGYSYAMQEVYGEHGDDDE
jgi:hypothetical protein